MDDVELGILDAWKRMAFVLKRDPEEFARRLDRRVKTLLGRPPRAWCLAVRASDTRLDALAAGADALAAGADALSTGDERPGGAPGPAPRSANAFCTSVQHSSFTLQHSPHSVALDASLVSRLCRAARIVWPGEAWDVVARKLGVSKRGLTMARLRKVFSVRYIRGLGGRHGKPVPILYTDRALDPAMQLFAPPDALWSWTATYLANRVPHELAQTIERVPWYVPTVAWNGRGEKQVYPSRALPPPADDGAWYKWQNGVYVGYDWRKPQAKEGFERHEHRKAMERASRKRLRQEHPKPSNAAGSLVFRGWRWLCPTCGKPVRTIYLPLPPINLLTASSQLMTHLPHHITEAQLGGQSWTERRFACGACHRVRCTSSLEPGAWNQFIRYLTGGLLFGREVPKPAWFAPTRKHAYSPQTTRASPRRQQVLRRSLEGATIRDIAAELGVGVCAIHNHVRVLCRQERVSDREELLRRHGISCTSSRCRTGIDHSGPPGPAPADRRGRGLPRPACA